MGIGNDESNTYILTVIIRIFISKKRGRDSEKKLIKYYISVTIGGGFLLVPLSSWNKILDVIADLDSLGRVALKDGDGAIGRRNKS